MNHRIFLKLRLHILLIAVASFVAIGFSQSREGVEGGRIVVAGDRDLVPVLARSDSPAALKVLQTAFTIHGGYSLVTSMQDASFAIKIDPAGGTSARLSISSGVPERNLFTETVSGESGHRAILAAIDRAIFKTSGKPGFFSGKIAWVSEETGASELYTSDLLFREITKLTSDHVSAVRPHWSPDGNYIIYTSYKSGFPDIHRLDMRTHRRDVVVDFKGTNVGARYSPDGSRIAMIITGGTNADVWVREADGSLQNLTRSRGLEAAPSWSPDGTRLVFSSDQSGGVQLYAMPSRGGNMSRLSTNISGYCAEPDWNNADANLISFTAAMGSGYQLAIFDMNRGESRFVTSESGDAIESQWLNDGRHIIYTHRRANDSEIKILDTKTLKSYVISGSLGKVSQASFLPPR